MNHMLAKPTKIGYNTRMNVTQRRADSITRFGTALAVAFIFYMVLAAFVTLN